MFFDIFTKTCKEKGISPSTLIRKLGMSPGYYSNWKNGTDPSSESLIKIADALDVSVDYLIGKDNIKKRSSSENEERIIKAMQSSELFKKLVEDFDSLSPESQAKAIDFLALLKRADSSINNK